MADSAGTILADMGLDTKEFDAKLAAARVRGIAAAMGIEKAFMAIGTTLTIVGGIIATVLVSSKIQAYVKEVTILAARIDTLGVVMNVVGTNAGYTSSQLSTFEKNVKAMGITSQAARNSLTLMAQSQLDLTKSSQLARVAQDAAVIGNVNSSEAFQRMIYAIKTGQPEMLRTLGLNVSFEASYVKMANSLNKATAELTEAEKSQARMNATLEYGTKIEGAYTASLDTAGKALLSMDRYIEEVKVKLGQAFQPAFKILVDAFTNMFKDMDKELQGFIDSGGMKELATGLAEGVRLAVAGLPLLVTAIKAVYLVIRELIDVAKSLAAGALAYLGIQAVAVATAFWTANSATIAYRLSSIAATLSCATFGTVLTALKMAVYAVTTAFHGLKATGVGIAIAAITYAIIKLRDVFKSAKEKADEFKESLNGLSNTKLAAALKELKIPGLDKTIATLEELDETGSDVSTSDKLKDSYQRISEQATEASRNIDKMIKSAQGAAKTPDGYNVKDLEEKKKKIDQYLDALDEAKEKFRKVQQQAIDAGKGEAKIEPGTPVFLDITKAEATLKKTYQVLEEATKVHTNKVREILDAAADKDANAQKERTESAIKREITGLETIFEMRKTQEETNNKVLLEKMKLQGKSELAITLATSAFKKQQAEALAAHKEKILAKETELMKKQGKDHVVIEDTVATKLMGIAKEKSRVDDEIAGEDAKAAAAAASKYPEQLAEAWSKGNTNSKKALQARMDMVKIQAQKEIEAADGNSELITAIESSKNYELAEMTRERTEKQSSAMLDYYKEVGIFGEEYKKTQETLWDAQAQAASDAIGGIISKEKFLGMYRKKEAAARAQNDLEYYAEMEGSAADYAKTQEAIIKNQARLKAATSNISMANWEKVLKIQEDISKKKDLLSFLEDTNKKYSEQAMKIREAIWANEDLQKSNAGVISKGEYVNAMRAKQSVEMSEATLDYYSSAKTYASDYLEHIKKVSENEYQIVWDLTKNETIARKAAVDKAKDYLIDALKSTQSFTNGVVAGLLEVQKEVKTNAEIMAQAVKDVFDGVADEIAELAATGEADFSKMFQNIAKTMLKAHLKQLMSDAFSGLTSGTTGLLNSLTGKTTEGGATGILGTLVGAITGKSTSATGLAAAAGKVTGTTYTGAIFNNAVFNGGTGTGTDTGTGTGTGKETASQKTLFTTIKEKVFSWVDSFKEAGSDAWTWIKNTAGSVWDTIATAGKSVLSGIGTTLQSLFGGSGRGSGLGGLVSGAGSLLKTAIGGVGTFLGSLFHEGGVVGYSGGMYKRAIPAYALAGVPRFHDGLASDEFLGILQKGEKVIPKNEVGKTEQQVNTTISVPITVNGEMSNEKISSLRSAIEQTVRKELGRSL